MMRSRGRRDDVVTVPEVSRVLSGFAQLDKRASAANLHVNLNTGLGSESRQSLEPCGGGAGSKTPAGACARRCVAGTSKGSSVEATVTVTVTRTVTVTVIQSNPLIRW
eukprot:2227542-Rhodomonas_salina.2